MLFVMLFCLFWKGLQFVLAGFSWSVSIVCLLVIQKIMQKGLQFGSCFAKILNLDFTLVNPSLLMMYCCVD
jgi:hypothetical protein